jgi:predicted nucleic acid-binding protein
LRLLLDSSVLIDVLRGQKSRRELLARLVSDGHHLKTTVVNVAEIYMGIRLGEAPRIEALFALLDCYALDAETAKQAGMLKSTWGKKGVTISLPDAIVAAIAIDQNCVLATDNRKDFPMPELNLYPLT